MAEGLLKSFDPELEVYSAGTKPADKVNPFAILTMKEICIDISVNFPKNVNRFINQSFDYVITVCDNAKETCPVFTAQVKNRLHFAFEDPADALGNDTEVLTVFRRIRDEIKNRFYQFYINTLTRE